MLSQVGAQKHHKVFVSTMWVVTLVIVAVILALCLWYLNRKRKYRDVDNLPGPPKHPIFGNALEFGNNLVEVFENINRIVKTYGGIVRIWQGPFRLNLFITDPKYVEYFLTSNVHIKKSAGYDLYKPWLGRGLINSSGDHWRKHRKIVTPAFHFKILDQFTDTFHSAGKIFIEKLKKEDSKGFDIYPYIAMYAMDAICESSMRIDANSQINSDTTYIDAVKVFLEIYMKRFFSVFKRHDFFFQYTSDYKKLQETLAILKGYTERVISQRKAEKQGITEDATEDEFGIKKKKKVFLDILLDGKQMNDEEIREEVDTFLFGGHDTVSTAIGFGIFELAKHRHVQEEILSEIHAVVGRDKDIEITSKHLLEMGYLDRVMKEIVRMYPSAPLMERELLQDAVLDGIRIPAGVTVSFHLYTQHRREELFPEPDKFDPDRFLPDNVASRHPFAYIPFSAGPRNCIGQKYALLNSKVTIANVIRNFEIHAIEPAHKLVLTNDAVLKSISGLPVKLKQR